MPTAFGNFECPCGGVEWFLLVRLDDSTIEKLSCVRCGKGTWIKLSFKEKLSVQARG